MVDAPGYLAKYLNDITGTEQFEVASAIIGLIGNDVQLGLVYQTKAAIDADLAHDANSSGWVVADATLANNGIYRKSGASGTGSWTKVTEIPYRLITLTDEGDGTANALKAESDLPVPAGAFKTLMLLNVFEENSGAATLSVNNGTAKSLVSVTGAALTGGSLQPGMILLLTDDGTNYRILTDFSSAANEDLARRWANGADGVQVDPVDHPGEYSARYFKNQAQEARDVVLGLASSFILADNTFTTIAAASTWSPAAAPDYVRTAFYDSDKVIGSGALYKKAPGEPGHQGKFSITLSDGVTVVWYELFELEPNAKMFGAKEAGADASAAIQAFFDYVTSVRCGKAILAGDFNIAAGIVLNGAAAYTRHFEFAATLRATGPIDTMFRFNNGNSFEFDGRLEVYGNASSAWAGRLCRQGIYVFNCGRAKFGDMFAQYFKEWGVYEYAAVGSGSNNGQAQFKSVKAIYCGSFSGAGLPANYSSPANTGGTDSFTQYTTINVDVLPPNTVEARSLLFVTIGSGLYYVASAGIDDGAGTIRIFPWIDPAVATSGTLRYIFGGAVASLGNDNSVIDTGQIDAQLCGIGFWDGALYGATVRMLVAQSCGVGYVIGTNLSSAHESSLVTGIYCEVNTFDIVIVQASPVKATAICTYETSFAKMMSIGPRRGDNTLLDSGFGVRGLTIIRDKVYSGDKQGKNLRDLTNAPSIAHKDADIYKTNAITFNLTYNADINRLYGWDALPIIVYGTGTFNNPTGTITFNPPSGWTVNGGASAVFKGFYGPAHFIVKFITATLDVKVILVAGREHPEAVTTIATNAAANITPWSTAPTVVHTGTLTADRTLTLVTTDAVAGKTRFRIVRTGSGAFNLSVGGLKNLATNTWCEVVFDGSAYVLTAYGAL